MVGNNPIIWWDYLGLRIASIKNKAWIYVKWDDCNTNSWWVSNIKELAAKLKENANGRKICYIEIEDHGWHIGEDTPDLDEKGGMTEEGMNKFIKDLVSALDGHMKDTSKCHLDGCETSGNDNTYYDREHRSTEAGRLSIALLGEYMGNIGNVQGSKITGPLFDAEHPLKMAPNRKRTYKGGKEIK